MKRYCYNCNHWTDGEETHFCENCGRSFDVRLCPRMHSNPRHAEVCSQCGSRDLSIPGPKIPASWQLTVIVVRVGLGLLLVYASLSFLIALFADPNFQALLFSIGLILVGLWFLYSRLPHWMQETIRSLWKGRNNDD